MNKVAVIPFIVALTSLLPLTSSAKSFHCEQDSLKAVSILRNTELVSLPSGERVAAIAQMFDGVPAAELCEAAGDTTGFVQVRFCSMDPLQFVNNVLALNEMIIKQDSDADLLPKHYAEFGRRKGKAASDWMTHFLFPADWLNDNTYRRNIVEVTGTSDQTLRGGSKTIDYVTHNRAQYAALKDPELYDRVRRAEMGYVQYPYRYLTVSMFAKPSVKNLLKTGDILVLYTNEHDLDSRDVAFVAKEGNEPFIIHVSPGEGKVCREELPLDKYLKRNVKRITGVRVFRLP